MTPPIDLVKLVESANSLRPLTKRNYLVVVNQWLEFAGADPAGWTVPICQAFYDHLLARGVAPRTANSMITGGLSFVFRRANAMYGIPSIVGGTDRVKIHADPDAETQRALTSTQALALLTACHGDDLASLRDHALITLGLYTGLRRMSLVSVDVDGATPQVGHSYLALRVLLKGGDWYHVPIDPRVWESMAAYRSLLTKLRPESGPLFTRLRRPVESIANPGGVHLPGVRLTSDGVYFSLTNRAAAAGLAWFHPHSLRHTFVTWCRVAKVDTELVAVVTGHKASTMIGHYTDKHTFRGQYHAQAALQCYEAVAKQLRV